jgi:hypothetical protein
VKEGNPFSIFFVSSLASLWSPLAMIGLIPFVVIVVFYYKSKFKEFFNIQNIVGGLFIISILYIFYSDGYLNNSDKIAGPIWKFIDINNSFLWLLFFYMLQFGFYFLIIGTKKGVQLSFLSNQLSMNIFIGCLCSLIVIPLYKLGNANDWAMRVNIPSLFILQIFMMDAFNSRKLEGLRSAIFNIFVIIGFSTAILEIRTLITSKAVLKSNVITLENKFSSVMKDVPLVQYTGQTDGIFGQYFSPEKKLSHFQLKLDTLDRSDWTAKGWRNGHPLVDFKIYPGTDIISISGENVCSGIVKAFEFKKGNVYKITGSIMGRGVHNNPDKNVGGARASITIEAPGFIGVEFPEGDFDWTTRYFYYRPEQDENRNIVVAIGLFGTGWGKIFVKDISVQELDLPI